jgi:poly(3-hydroxybutyrate) depolymerase
MSRHSARTRLVYPALALASVALTIRLEGLGNATSARQTPTLSDRQALDILSSLDGSSQRSYLVVPPDLPDGPRPLLVILHAWGSNNEGRWPPIEREAATRGWLVLTPNFRGPSDHPEGCGSLLAQQDILDAVAFVGEKLPRISVDKKRIYVMGYSGGGFMTMLIAARHPDTWAAASAWAGIADLAAWYQETSQDTIRDQLRACFGGPPDDRLTAQYRERSPIAYLRPSLPVPIEIAHGDHDPQVSMTHAFRAFDLLAPGAVSAVEVERIKSRRSGSTPSERDALFKGDILLRRSVRAFRLTIYDGGHDFYALAGMAWLAEHSRP